MKIVHHRILCDLYVRIILLWLLLLLSTTMVNHPRTVVVTILLRSGFEVELNVQWTIIIRWTPVLCVSLHSTIFEYIKKKKKNTHTKIMMSIIYRCDIITLKIKNKKVLPPAWTRLEMMWPRTKHIFVISYLYTYNYIYNYIYNNFKLKINLFKLKITLVSGFNI